MRMMKNNNNETVKLAMGRLPLGTPARQWRKYSCEMSTGHFYRTLTD